ncbi:MAG: glycosyltransferase family 2 protein [Halomonas sp.]|nr:glycosyltransferase family 2 protein [Halomonas sp.]MBP5980585.1 glycosyltransferase family 2 protein [Halomonas sp.]
MKLAIAAIVKNEADSLVEWLAFHLAVGASHFLIADNESNDGTYELLEPLAASGLVTLVSVPTIDEPPQLTAYQKLLNKCPKDVDLVAFIDADEYLLPVNEASGTDHTSPGLLPWLEERFASAKVGALALNWACFGSNGAKFRDEGLVIERFTKRAKQAFGPNHHFKSVVRPTWVERFANPHFAYLKQGEYVNALGQPVEPRLGKDSQPRIGLSEQVVWGGARINHYLVKSVEEFVLGKAKRGSAATPNYTKQREYFVRHDRNDTECLMAAERVPEVKRRIAWLQHKIAAAAELAPTPETSAEASFDLKRWLKRKVKAWSSSSDDDQPIERWALDFPSEQRGSRFMPSGRVVQGWLLLPAPLAEMQDQVRIVAEWKEAFELSHPLEIDRPDVIENVLEEGAETHPQRRSGFRFTVPPRLGQFRLWLALGDERWLLQEVSIDTSDAATEQPLKVLEGKQGWLFLDNDTNGSVDQFMGRMHLTENGTGGWKTYLTQSAELAASTPWALLVAPSKESIMGKRYHPRVEGVGGPMHQVLALPEASNVVYPVEALKALSDGAFIPTDTHWTHKGAMVAAVALAAKLGVPEADCKALFAKDTYKLKTMGGDLGNKLSPKQTSDVEVLTSFNHNRYKTYENGLPNFGRILVIEYPKALVPGTCLVFGSSSSYSMLNYLSRIFARLVFVHSAGNLDPALVKAVAPDYLAAQTNARFVVQIPSASHDIEAVIQQKSALLDEKGLEGVREKRIIAPDDYLQEVGLLAWEKIASELVK